MLTFLRPLLAGLCLAAASPVFAQDAPVFDEKQTKAIEDTIKTYLLKNPEILLEVQSELQKKAEAQLAERRKPVLKDLYSAKSDYAAGEGSVTVVEFFDYNCPHCRTAFTTVSELLKDGKKVRFVFIDVPFFSDPPVIKASLAAAKQGKYFEYHAALNAVKGQIGEADALRIAKEIGLDVEQLKKDMNSKEIEERLIGNIRLAQSLGVDSTPAFFVGDKTVLGSLREELIQAIEETQKNGCSICGDDKKRS